MDLRVATRISSSLSPAFTREFHPIRNSETAPLGGSIQHGGSTADPLCSNQRRDSRKQMNESGTTTKEQTPYIIYVRYADGRSKLATATSNSAAWMCSCGLTAPLAGRAPVSYHHEPWTVCPNCEKRFRVTHEGDDLVVLEAGLRSQVDDEADAFEAECNSDAVRAPPRSYSKIELFRPSLLKLNDGYVVDE